MKPTTISSGLLKHYSGERMKRFNPNVFALFLVASLTMNFSFAADNPRVHSHCKDGLRTTTFETPNGKIAVFLPADLKSGDQISGTVVAGPTGKNQKQIFKNKSTLEGYVLEFADKQTPAGKGKEIWKIPAILSASNIFLNLKDSKGRLIGSTELPVLDGTLPGVPAVKAKFNLSPYLKSGEQAEITGPFDGDFSTSSVSINGRPAEVLAESPGRVLIQLPQTATGAARVVVSENGTIFNGVTNLLDVNLSAGKLNLLRGETTSVTLEVSGSEGMDVPVKIEIVNHTPEIITLEGKPSDTLTVNGKTPVTFQARAISTGSFSIGAYIINYPQVMAGTDRADEEIDYDKIKKAEDLPDLIRPAYDRYSLARVNGKSHEKAMDEAFSSDKAKNRWKDIFKKIYGK